MDGVYTSPATEASSRIYYVLGRNCGWDLPQILPLFIASNKGGACFKKVAKITAAMYGKKYTPKQYKKVHQALKRLEVDGVLLRTEEVHYLIVGGKKVAYAGGAALTTYRVNPEKFNPLCFDEVDDDDDDMGVVVEEEAPTPATEVLPANTPTKTAAKPVRSIPRTATKPVRSIPTKTPVVAPVEKKPAAPVVEEPSVKEFFEAEVTKWVSTIAPCISSPLAGKLGKEWMLQNIFEACFEDNWVTTQLDSAPDERTCARAVDAYLTRVYGLTPPHASTGITNEAFMRKLLRKEENAFRLPGGPAKQAKPATPAYVEWNEDSPVKATTVDSVLAEVLTRRAVALTANN